MPKKRLGESIQARFFTWVLIGREGVYYADGRSNTPPAGRHSLRTADRAEAIRRIHQLDESSARQLGLIAASSPDNPTLPDISLREGRELFEKHQKRPRVLQGTTPKTQARYRAVFDKFLPFAEGKGVRTWRQVDVRLVRAYANELQIREYQARTIYLEVTVLKQVVKWLIEEKQLSESCRLRIPMRKVEQTLGYCYRLEEIDAMVAHCREKDLTLLKDLIVGLTYTGCRVSEILQLRWRNVDLQGKKIHIVDESHLPERSRSSRSTTKNQQSRTIPIKEPFLEVLRSREKLSGDWVYASRTGKKIKVDHIRRQFIKEVIEPLSDRFPSQEGEKGFASARFHAFRHYFCSTCANTGVPEPVVREWMGHRDSKMIRHYYHLNDTEASKQMGRVNFMSEAALNGEVGGFEGSSEEGERNAATEIPRASDSLPGGLTT